MNEGEGGDQPENRDAGPRGTDHGDGHREGGAGLGGGAKGGATEACITIKIKLKKYVQLPENENTAYHIIWDAVNTVQRIKIIAQDAQLRNEGTSEIITASFYIRKLKKKILNSKQIDRIIKNEVSEIETREIIKQIIKTIKLVILIKVNKISGIDTLPEKHRQE